MNGIQRYFNVSPGAGLGYIVTAYLLGVSAIDGWQSSQDKIFLFSSVVVAGITTLAALINLSIYNTTSELLDEHGIEEVMMNYYGPITHIKLYAEEHGLMDDQR